MKAIVKARSFVFGAMMAVSLPVMAQVEPPPGGETPPTSPPPNQAPASTGGFGSQGQIVISADLPLLSEAPLVTVIRTSFSSNGMSSSATAVGVAPSADYFLAPNISVGGLIGYMDNSESTKFGIFARGGYSLALTDVLSLWPRLGLGYVYESGTIFGVPDSTSSSFWLTIEAPVLFHPASHFFVGGGPMLQTALTNSASVMGVSGDGPKRTDLGVMTLIGGYFGA